VTYGGVIKLATPLDKVFFLCDMRIGQCLHEVDEGSLSSAEVVNCTGIPVKATGIDGYLTGLDVVLFPLSTPKKESDKTNQNGQVMLESSFQMIILKIDGIPP
jgi:hypothetical protein